MAITATENDIVSVTHAAAQKIYDLMLEQNNTDLKLRIGIEGGGCSGFKYSFGFEDAIDEDDTLVEKSLTDKTKVQILIDTMSYPYLLGAEIDYFEDIQQSKFIIRNPNSKTTCGCGSSFNV